MVAPGSTGSPQGRPPRKTRKRFWTFRRFLLALIGFVVSLAVLATFIPTTRWVAGTGYLTTDLETELRPSVEGVIQERLVSQGDSVTMGQTLIQLRDASQQLAYEQAIQELNAKRSKLEYVLSHQDMSVKRREQQIQQLELQLELGKDRVERMRQAPHGAVSPVEINQAVLEVALIESKLVELLLPQEDVMAKEAQVLRDEISAAKSRVARHQDEILLRKITSPLNGVVFFHRFEIGEVVKPEHVLGQVFDTGEWVIKLKLPERKITYVQPGQTLEVELAATTGFISRPLSATISRVLPIVSPQATGDGVFYAEATITDFNNLVPQPGMSVRVRINTGRTNWLMRIVDW